MARGVWFVLSFFSRCASQKTYSHARIARDSRNLTCEIVSQILIPRATSYSWLCTFSTYLVLHILAYFEMLISASWWIYVHIYAYFAYTCICILCIYMHLRIYAYFEFACIYIFYISFRHSLEQIGNVRFCGRFRAWFKANAFNTRTGKVFQFPADRKCCAPAIAECSLARPISLIQIQTVASARGEGSFFRKLFFPLFPSLSFNPVLTPLNIPKVDDLV